MAGRKGTVENQDFLNQVMAASKSATKSVARAFDDGKKRIEYIDIWKMEAAPPEWNRYPLLRDSQPEKYLELKMSIYEKGVEDPLVLWQREGGTYTILAGHNRRAVCAEILGECGDGEGFKEEKFRYLPCVVYLDEELDEAGAREIIDDTNLYRDFSRLPEKTKVQIIGDRVETYKRRRYAKGERIDQLAKDFGIKKSSIYDALALNEKIIGPLQDLYFDGALKKKSVMRFTYFDKATQQWIFDEFGAQISDAKANALKKNMTRAEIEEVFATEDRDVRKITVEVPETRVEEFREMFKKWLRDGE